MPTARRPKDLPLHPAIVRWLGAYARAADGEKDATVARMLTELNALLHDASTPGDRERGAPGTGLAT